MKTIGTTIKTVQTRGNNGDTAVQKQTVVSTDNVSNTDYALAKVNQVVWFGIHLIGITVALRFVFLLFGANLTGIALFVYNLSAPFVAPFQGIFSSPRAGGAFFDSAALLALASWYIVGFIISYVLSLFSSDTTEAPDEL